MITTGAHVRAVLSRARRVTELREKARQTELTALEFEELNLLLVRLVDPPLRPPRRNSTARERSVGP